jgi:hypothetical protein
VCENIRSWLWEHYADIAGCPLKCVHSFRLPQGFTYKRKLSAWLRSVLTCTLWLTSRMDNSLSYPRHEPRIELWPYDQERTLIQLSLLVFFFFFFFFLEYVYDVFRLSMSSVETFQELMTDIVTGENFRFRFRMSVLERLILYKTWFTLASGRAWHPYTCKNIHDTCYVTEVFTKQNCVMQNKKAQAVPPSYETSSKSFRTESRLNIRLQQ